MTRIAPLLAGLIIVLAAACSPGVGGPSVPPQTLRPDSPMRSPTLFLSFSFSVNEKLRVLVFSSNSINRCRQRVLPNGVR